MGREDWLLDIESWWSNSGRQFPWRDHPEPYRVLISEWMLQRTRADLVTDVFSLFIGRYPSLKVLAGETETGWETIGELTRPLGRIDRWRSFRQTVKELRHNDCSVPDNEKDLLSVHGLGLYIARAVLVFGYGYRLGLIDPNIVRLLGRFLNIHTSKARARDDRILWNHADFLIEQTSADPRKANWGLIDLGAMVCSKKPHCDKCPLKYMCSY